jgi:hypothetical protein
VERSLRAFAAVATCRASLGERHLVQRVLRYVSDGTTGGVLAGSKAVENR